MEEESEKRMENIYGKLMEANHSKKKMEMNQAKRIVLLNPDLFQSTITKILNFFQVFLQEQIIDIGNS